MKLFKSLIKPLIGVLISTILVILIIQKINWSEFAQAFMLLNIYWVILGIIIQFHSFFLRTIRWKQMQFSNIDGSYYRLFSILSISYMLNSVLPLRLGDVARALLCSKQFLVSKTQSFTILLLEKFSDAVTIFITITLMLFFIDVPTHVTKLVAFLGSALAILLFLVFIAVHFDFFDYKLKLYKYIFKYEKAAYMIQNARNAINFIMNPFSLLKLLILSFLIWLLEAFGYYFIGIGFGFHWSYSAALFVMAVVNLATMIPSSPGYIGTFQYFIILSLNVIGIPFGLATAYSVVAHLAIFVPITFAGLCSFIATGMKISDIKSSKNEEG